MQAIQTRSELQALLAAWRSNGERVALVPTMGNLHAGHLSLVEIAAQQAEKVVVSSFVNPTQFVAGEDYDKYPRTPDADLALFHGQPADLLFAPDVATMYPFGIAQATRVVVPVLTDEFCAASRPGHFDGVTSVVMRLFALVQPDVAVFGQKDYQQQLIVRHMVADLGLPIRMELGPIVRETDGLAMSSRNAYLLNEERVIAAQLYATLQGVAAKLLAGQRDFGALEGAARRALAEAQQSPEYVAIRSAADLAVPDLNCKNLVVLAASRVGAVRLIDNIVVTTP